MCAAVLVAGCSGGDDATDAGPDVVQPGDGGADATVDAQPDADATVDAPADSPPDSPWDAAALDPTSQQILAVREASGTNLSLPIAGAVVTYTKALVGTDPAGFFIQAEQTGPALFVAVDPQTLTPVPVPGDQVSFTVTAASVVTGVHEATAITSFTRTAQGVSLATLLRDVSNASDLVSNLDFYESAYVSVAGDVKTSFGALGSGFVQAQMETAGLTGNAALNLRLRTPTTVKSALGIGVDCTFSLTGILFRYGGVAQPSGWVAGDFSNVVCNPPKVTAAVATSATAVRVTFDRDISGATVSGDGSQVGFDNGLVASAASPTSSNQVTVTTGAQTVNTTYTVTVASSVQDVLGKGVDATANHASFVAYGTVATLQLNEINPNITSSLDLIELRAKSAGTTKNITVEQNISGKVTLATLPDITVAQNDLIVVHLGSTTATTETTTMTDCSDAACYSGAWDVVGGTTGVTYSGRVLVVRSPTSVIQDGAAFYTGNPPSGFYMDVMSLQGAGAWLPADCGGNPCNTNTLAEGVSVVWTGCGSTPTGNSVARKANGDADTASDWAVGASSFGSSNP